MSRYSFFISHAEMIHSTPGSREGCILPGKPHLSRSSPPLLFCSLVLVSFCLAQVLVRDYLFMQHVCIQHICEDDKVQGETPTTSLMKFQIASGGDESLS